MGTNMHYVVEKDNEQFRNLNMGTDIHYVVEKETKDFGWVGIISTGDPFTSFQNREHTPIWKFKTRDYIFFERLCGVRGHGPNTSKGEPADASVMTLDALARMEYDSHSISHCSLFDFAVAKIKGTAEIGLIAADKLKGSTLAMNNFLELRGDEDVNDYRVVFWFDN